VTRPGDGLPVGFRLVPDGSTRVHDDAGIVVGGSPRRVLRLSGRGADVATRLLDGARVSSQAQSALARRLVAAGIAHPVPPAARASITVVVPTYDDDASLARCLDAVGNGQMPVVVVDDASADAQSVRDVVQRHEVRLVRLERNVGPGAARNRGARDVDAEVIAFVDSDAVVAPEALQRLSWHFADPAVAAVAPRVRARHDARHTVLAAVANDMSPLDMGPTPGRVAPGARIGYVPSTVLLVRRKDFEEVGGFDERLRYGEDVDLVWRLVLSGRDVRYVADVTVEHAEPTTWLRWWRRRHHYGSSAAELAARHGADALTLRVRSAPMAVVLLLVSRRPALAATVTCVTAGRVAQRLRKAGLPVGSTAGAATAAPLHTSVATARWLTQLWWPLLLVAARSRHARPAVVVALTLPGLTSWLERRPSLDPVRWVAAQVADDVAYGSGVWVGALRRRTWGPLLPRLR
jgi:mycofactocin system glycosyltransferase